jgi:Glycosyltransferase family 87
MSDTGVDAVPGRPSRFVRLTRRLDHPAILPALIVAGAVFIGSQVLAADRGERFSTYDAHVYWLAARSADPYAATIASGFDDAVNPYKYRYPPPLAQILAPLALLPWPVFAGLWLTMLYAVFLALAGRWALPLLVLYPPVLAELYVGNINLLIAAAVVVGMRHPVVWAFVALTKMTPVAGVLWFVLRREWRSVGLTLLTSFAICAISFLVSPALWSRFAEALATQADASVNVPLLAIPVSLPVRLVLALAVGIYGARNGLTWTVPIVVTLASPVIWLNVLVILLGCIPLLERRGLMPARAPLRY